MPHAYAGLAAAVTLLAYQRVLSTYYLQFDVSYCRLAVLPRAELSVALKSSCLACTMLVGWYGCWMWALVQGWHVRAYTMPPAPAVCHARRLRQCLRTSHF